MSNIKQSNSLTIYELANAHAYQQKRMCIFNLHIPYQTQYNNGCSAAYTSHNPRQSNVNIFMLSSLAKKYRHVCCVMCRTIL